SMPGNARNRPPVRGSGASTENVSWSPALKPDASSLTVSPCKQDRVVGRCPGSGANLQSAAVFGVTVTAWAVAPQFVAGIVTSVCGVRLDAKPKTPTVKVPDGNAGLGQASEYVWLA